MNYKICFVLQVLLLCSGVLSQDTNTPSASSTTTISPPTTTPVASTTSAPSSSTTATITLTAEQIVAAGQAAIRATKSAFDAKLTVERNTKAQLISAITNFENNFYRSLRDELFNNEETKANTIQNSLRNIPDANCAVNLNNFNSQVQNRDVRNEFVFCKSNIDCQVKEIRDALNNAQRDISDSVSTESSGITFCSRLYATRRNLAQLNACVARSTANVQSVAEKLTTTLAKYTPEKPANNLARCVDQTITTIQNSLNSNYELLIDCLRSSTNRTSIQLADDIASSYLLNLNTNSEADVAQALGSEIADSIVTLEAVADLRNKIDELTKLRSKSTSAIRQQIATNADVLRYQNALSNASLVLNYNPRARECVTAAQTSLNILINNKTNVIQRCSSSINIPITLAALNVLEKSVTDRETQENGIVTIDCLATGAVTSNTVSCSEQSHTSFDSFLKGLELTINGLSQNADKSKSIFTKCESSTEQSIKPTLGENALTFNNCLLTRSSLSYTLTV